MPQSSNLPNLSANLGDTVDVSSYVSIATGVPAHPTAAKRRLLIFYRDLSPSPPREFVAHRPIPPSLHLELLSTYLSGIFSTFNMADNDAQVSNLLLKPRFDALVWP